MCYWKVKSITDSLTLRNRSEILQGLTVVVCMRQTLGLINLARLKTVTNNWTHIYSDFVSNVIFKHMTVFRSKSNHCYQSQWKSMWKYFFFEFIVIIWNIVDYDFSRCALMRSSAISTGVNTNNRPYIYGNIINII